MPSNGFAKLRKDLLGRKDIKAITKLAYAFIVDAIRGKHVAWPGVRTIAKGIGCAPATAERAIKQIEETGLLEVEHGGDGKRNQYRRPNQNRTHSDDASALETSTVPDEHSVLKTSTGVLKTSTEAYSKRVPKKTRLNKKTSKRSKPTDDEVESIYRAYPRKVARKAGFRAIVIALKEIPHAELLAHTERYARSVNGKEKRFLPHPATWFNGERWADLDAEPESDFQQALQEVRSGQ